MDTRTDHRYQHLARLISKEIDDAGLVRGQRLPSVRAVSDKYGVSGSTALQAYRLLASRGAIVARAQSGFYVDAVGRRSKVRGVANVDAQRARDAHRYEQLADLIVGMIDNGALAAGTKLPSVRAISEQHRISVSTVLQAYRLLVDRGVIVARPQSGFYVVACEGARALPSVSRPPVKASIVSISGAVAVLLEHAHDSALVPLGCAVPDPTLLQSRSLDLALSRAARRHGARYNVYGTAQGHLELRREIAGRAMRHEHALSPDDILITGGCTEAVTLALMTVANRGDIVAVESPTYFGLLHTLEVLGLKALELPTHPTRGIDIAALARAVESQPVAACILSSTFSNPLGGCMSETDKKAVLEVLNRLAVPLIEDDVYGDIYFDGERPKPFIALEGGANTIYCSSFSKTLAPGYRVGWIASKAYTKQVVERKLALNLCNPILPQVALAEVLASGAYETHLRRLRRILESNLINMSKAVESSFPNETKVSRPKGGFALWLELPEQFDSRALFDGAIERGICFTPGDVFSAGRHFRNCLRLGAGYAWSSRIEDGVHCLGHLAQAQMSSSALVGLTREAASD